MSYGVFPPVKRIVISKVNEDDRGFYNTQSSQLDSSKKSGYCSFTNGELLTEQDFSSRDMDMYNYFIINKVVVKINKFVASAQTLFHDAITQETSFPWSKVKNVVCDPFRANIQCGVVKDSGSHNNEVMNGTHWYGWRKMRNGMVFRYYPRCTTAVNFQFSSGGTTVSNLIKQMGRPNNVSWGLQYMPNNYEILGIAFSPTMTQTVTVAFQYTVHVYLTLSGRKIIKGNIYFFV